MPDNLPDQADVVVIGGGIIGLSTAWHLCRRGFGSVVVLERDRIASGTTWHAAGLIGSVRPSETLHKLIHRIYGFVEAVEEDSGLETGFRRVGSLWIADDADRWSEIRRLHDQTRVWGPESHLISPREIQDAFPLIDTDGLLGGMFAPGEGWISPVDFAQAVARAARSRGAQIIEKAPVDSILLENGQVRGVQVDGHRIRTSAVANCAGLWGREVGQMAGADVPLQAVEHYYAVTVKDDEIPRDLPVLRDLSAGAYIKEDAGSILVGAFEKRARPIDPATLPRDFGFGELEGDFEGQFLPIYEAATRRFPILGRLGIRKFFCGPESFTPDGRVQIGPDDGVRGLWSCCGCNSQGIQCSAGYGSALADWIADGRAPCDLSALDVRRNEPLTNSKTYVWERSVETLGLLYDHHYPYRQLATARGVRRSPLHEQLRARGACFGEVAGIERANWFAPEGVKPEYCYSFGRQNWHDHAAVEHRAFREGVGIIDLSSFAVFEVRGPDACQSLQRISTADIDRPPGRVAYTHWLNDAGGIEADLTVLRLGPEHFQVITGAAVRRRDKHWLEQHLDSGTEAAVSDISAGCAIIGVFGPLSAALLAELTGADFSDSGLPRSHTVRVEIGAAEVLAARVSFAGGPGYELHMSSDVAAYVFEFIEAAGRDYGLRPCGMHALDSCRIERGLVHYGHEVSQEETPFHVGLGFVCDFGKKDGFIGRKALLDIRERGSQSLDRRLASVLLCDPEPMLFGHEPILRNGEPVGYVTSGAYGHTLGASIGLGWLCHAEDVSPEWVSAGRYQVLVENRPIDARASLRPFVRRDGQPRTGQ